MPHVVTLLYAYPLPTHFYIVNPLPVRSGDRRSPSHTPLSLEEVELVTLGHGVGDGIGGGIVVGVVTSAPSQANPRRARERGRRRIVGRQVFILILTHTHTHTNKIKSISHRTSFTL